jgi:hypothetical protein
LGGPGAGNGSFNTGESYSLERNLPTVAGILLPDPDPTAAEKVLFTVTFSEDVSGVDTADFAPVTTGGISGAGIGGVSGSGKTYTVTVNTGIGDGTLSLNVIDDDSILDVVANPLGGPGAGNGAFTTESKYTVNKNAPTVISSLRTDADPTTAAAVNYVLTFSEPVIGVDASDFALTTTGELSGSSIIGLNGSASSYTISIAIGNGSGTLRLDLVDNDSILDSANQPLGGPGTGNGDFISGETYTISKPQVTIQSASFRSSGATALRPFISVTMRRIVSTGPSCTFRPSPCLITR